MSHQEHAEVQKQVEGLLKKGLILECVNPCVVPVILVLKKDGVSFWLSTPSTHRARHLVHHNLHRTKALRTLSWSTSDTLSLIIPWLQGLGGLCIVMAMHLAHTAG
jgi:hypothetical protein